MPGPPHQPSRGSQSWGELVMLGVSPEGPSLSPQPFLLNPVSLLSLGWLPALVTLG